MMSSGKQKRSGRASLWVAGSIVAVAVLAGTAGVIGLAINSNNKPAAEVEGPGEQATPSLPAESPVDESECDVPGGSITATPSDLEWQTVSGVSWPTSPSLGPVSKIDGFPVCFSHSPVGAALAASTVLYESLRQNPADVGEFYMVDSPGKQTALAETEGQTSSELLAQFTTHGMTAAGFRVDEYTDDRALVYLVIAVPGSRTGYRGIPRPMVWENGDWRLKVLDTGSTGQAIDVLDGQFTRWAD